MNYDEAQKMFRDSYSSLLVAQPFIHFDYHQSMMSLIAVEKPISLEESWPEEEEK